MASNKAKYYGEPLPPFGSELQEQLFDLESREATGILWSAIRHIQTANPHAAEIMHRLRDELIEDYELHGEDSHYARHKTLFLYRMNTVGLTE